MFWRYLPTRTPPVRQSEVPMTGATLDRNVGLRQVREGGYPILGCSNTARRKHALTTQPDMIKLSRSSLPLPGIGTVPGILTCSSAHRPAPPEQQHPSACPQRDVDGGYTTQGHTGPWAPGYRQWYPPPMDPDIRSRAPPYRIHGPRDILGHPRDPEVVLRTGKSGHIPIESPYDNDP